MSQLPRVIINVAQSINGYIAGPSGRRVVISDEEDRKRVHGLRAAVDAVLVGVNTIINDNPSLTVDPRYFPEKRGLQRIILDRNLRIPQNAHVLTDGNSTIIFTANRKREITGAKVVPLTLSQLRLGNLMSIISDMGIGSILVEGGRDVIRQFVLETTVSEFLLYVGDVIIEAGGLRLFEPPEDLRGVILHSDRVGKGVLFSIDPIALRQIWK
ncbi:MAG: RibD family protein [Thermoplasmataceae archaeon]